jgi:uncharacterized membrane protein
MSFIKDLMSNSGVVSSARVINITGAVVGAGLIIADIAQRGMLDATNFGIYLAYCGGVYTIGKGISAVGHKYEAESK